MWRFFDRLRLNLGARDCASLSYFGFADFKNRSSFFVSSRLCGGNLEEALAPPTMVQASKLDTVCQCIVDIRPYAKDLTNIRQNVNFFTASRK